jgi:hypothetical protein
MTLGADYSGGSPTGQYTTFQGYQSQAAMIIVQTNKGEIPYQSDQGGNIKELLSAPLTDLPAIKNDFAIQLEERLPSWLKNTGLLTDGDSADEFKVGIKIVLKNTLTGVANEVTV